MKHESWLDIELNEINELLPKPVKSSELTNYSD